MDNTSEWADRKISNYDNARDSVVARGGAGHCHCLGLSLSEERAMARLEAHSGRRGLRSHRQLVPDCLRLLRQRHRKSQRTFTN